MSPVACQNKEKAECKCVGPMPRLTLSSWRMSTGLGRLLSGPALRFPLAALRRRPRDRLQTDRKLADHVSFSH